MIHVIIGPPCAGKSTFVKENAKENDLRVDFDLLAECLGNSKKHEATGLVKEAAFKAREGAIETALKNPDAESWIIHTSPTKAQMAAYEKAGAEIIALEVSKEECLARAERDGRPQTTIDGINKYFSEEKGSKMAHLFKTFEMKATDTGSIEGYFSTYDKTPDSYGDIIDPGAFTDTIKKREESGHPFPLCFNHDFSAVIGSAASVKDTEKGPFVEADFLDTQLAQDVRKMLQSGAIYQFSFAYDVLERRNPTAEEKAAGVTNVLTKLEVFEISVVTVPANQNAVVTEVKACRRNSKADEDTIKQIINLAQSLLTEGDDNPTEEDPGEEVAPEANGSAPEEQKGADNSATRSADLLETIKKIKGGVES